MTGEVQTYRDGIMALENAIRALPPEDQVDGRSLPVRETFPPGLYVRELFLPAGLTVVGEIHKTGFFNFVLGHCEVRDGAGEPILVIDGAEQFETLPGAKRAVYAVTDTWWTTVHANPGNLRADAEIRAMLLAPSFEALDAPPEAVHAAPQLGAA